MQLLFQSKRVLTTGVKYTLSVMTNRMIVMNIRSKALMNHATQCTPFPRPIIFITSFNLCSFSCTILFTIMATDRIHESTINRGNDLEIANTNLTKNKNKNIQYYQKFRCRFLHKSIRKALQKYSFLNPEIIFHLSLAW